jgi:formylglycine-generating enzyme required for sulfatase activity
MVKPNRVWYGKGVKESDDKRIPTSPAGLRPLGAGPFGAQDQAGNCWEWCLDSWTNPWKEQIPPDTDLFKWLQHQGKHHTRTIRGGSWKVAVASLRAACRASETSGKEEEATGFRVVVEE